MDLRGSVPVTFDGFAGEERLALDVDEERGHVDEVACGVDVGLLEVMGVVEKLAGDAGDGNVVDVDILLADEVEEEVHGAVVNVAYGDGEGGLGCFFFFPGLGGAFWVGGWGLDGAGFQGEGLAGVPRRWPREFGVGWV